MTTRKEDESQTHDAFLKTASSASHALLFVSCVSMRRKYEVEFEFSFSFPKRSHYLKYECFYALVHPSVRRRRETWEGTPLTGPECPMHAGHSAGHLASEVRDSEEQGRQCSRWLSGGRTSLAIYL